MKVWLIKAARFSAVRQLTRGDATSQRLSFSLHKTCSTQCLRLLLLPKGRAPRRAWNGKTQTSSFQVMLTLLCSSCRFTLPFSLIGIPVIPYSPDAAPDNVLCFRHYNPTEVMHTTEPRVATLATAHSPLQCMKANNGQV